MYQPKQRKLVYFHFRKRKNNKIRYFYLEKKSSVIYLVRRSLYRNPASGYRSRRERKTNSYPKVIKIADFFSNSCFKGY